MLKFTIWKCTVQQHAVHSQHCATIPVPEHFHHPKKKPRFLPAPSPGSPNPCTTSWFSLWIYLSWTLCINGWNHTVISSLTSLEVMFLRFIPAMFWNRHISDWAGWPATSRLPRSQGPASEFRTPGKHCQAGPHVLPWAPVQSRAEQADSQSLSELYWGVSGNSNTA